MKVVVKKVSQESFEIEADASSSVRDVKNKLSEQHALGSPDQLKLIFRGKLLADEETLSGSVNFTEGGFMIVMVKKVHANPAVAGALAMFEHDEQEDQNAAMNPFSDGFTGFPAAAEALVLFGHNEQEEQNAATGLLNSCSRSVTVTRVSAGEGVLAYRVETGAFPEAASIFPGAAAVELPHAASDEMFTPLFLDGRKEPDFFIGDGDESQQKNCGICLQPLLGLDLGESRLIRQLMCHRWSAATQESVPLDWTPLRNHYFPCVFHAGCVEAWFATKQNEIDNYRGVPCPTGCGSRFGFRQLPFPVLSGELISHLLMAPSSEGLGIQSIISSELAQNPDLTALDLSEKASDNSLRNVTFPPSIALLRLCNGAIQRLQSISFPPALRFLNLSRNQIVALPERLDERIPNVEILHLDRNQISSLQHVVFPAQLKVLDLDGNRIVSLQDVVLPATLEKLSVANNLVTGLQGVVFPDTIQELDFSNAATHSSLSPAPPSNCITSLQGAVFPPALQVLNLRNNKIESLNQGAVVQFPPAIQRIFLDQNRIKHLQGFVFRSPSSLRYLSLLSNPIFDLQDYVLPPNLNVLCLHDNPVPDGICAPPGCNLVFHKAEPRTPELRAKAAAERAAAAAAAAEEAARRASAAVADPVAVAVLNAAAAYATACASAAEKAAGDVADLDADAAVEARSAAAAAFAAAASAASAAAAAAAAAASTGDPVAKVADAADNLYC
jgi:Leucine-rich repeat (LRR) protein